jgi:hypothetical protein
VILTRAIEQGWRERADLHASLMVPSALLLALLDAVKAGREFMEIKRLIWDKQCRAELASYEELQQFSDALAAWRRAVGE